MGATTKISFHKRRCARRVSKVGAAGIEKQQRLQEKAKRVTRNRFTFGQARASTVDQNLGRACLRDDEGHRVRNRRRFCLKRRPAKPIEGFCYFFGFFLTPSYLRDVNSLM